MDVHSHVFLCHFGIPSKKRLHQLLMPLSRQGQPHSGVLQLLEVRTSIHPIALDTRALSVQSTFRTVRHVASSSPEYNWFRNGPPLALPSPPDVRLPAIKEPLAFTWKACAAREVGEPGESLVPENINQSHPRRIKRVYCCALDKAIKRKCGMFRPGVPLGQADFC